MRRLAASFYLGCLFCLSPVALPAAQAADIGYVNMERVLKESKLGREAETRLEERFGKRTEPFQEEEQAIRQLQATLERDKPLMSESQVTKKEAEIKQRIEKFEKDFTVIQRELMQAQQEEAVKILEPARKSVAAVAKEKKLAAVFESSQASQVGLLYLDSDNDLTDAVLKHLDAKK